MKKGVITLLLVAAFLLPLAGASIIIDGPAIDRYNIGDKVTISGYIQENEATDGFLKFSVQCGDQNFQIQPVPITLHAGQQKIFPNEIQIPEFTISKSMSGDCRIRADLTSGNAIVDSAESRMFTVTKDLEGSFSIGEPRVQIGSDLVLTGEVSKLDNTRIDGSAEIFFRQNDTKFMVSVLEFKGGEISYTSTMQALPEGRYFVDVEVTDSFGNEQLFQDASNFVLIKDLYLTAKIDKDQYLPGDIVIISGDAKTVLQDPVPSAIVVLTLGPKSFTTRMLNGKFEGTFQIPHNIQSGRQAILVSIKDEFGNVGQTKIRLYITAVPSNINVRLNANDFLPGELIEVTSTLYDQASEVMTGDMKLEIADAEGNIVMSKSVESQKKELFMFPKFAKPGRWKITTTKGELVKEEIVNLKEYANLGVAIEDTLLKIINQGNIDFSDKVQIEATSDGQTYVVDRKESIAKNDSSTIELSGQLPTGMYSLNVKTPYGEQSFDNVNILKGKSWHSFNMAYLLLVAVCVGFLVYMSFSKITPPKQTFGQRKLPFKIKDIEHESTKKRFSVFDIGKDKESEMSDFKSRILKDIKQAEADDAKRKQREFFSRRETPEFKPKQKEGGGMFSMFD